MKNILQSIAFFAIIFLLTSITFSQDWDNPFLDQVPPKYRPFIRTLIFPQVQTLTDNVGFDNFYLGIDFAEPHISVSLQNPKWFFTAYNTNNPHSTLDGLNWFANVPSLPSPAGDPVTAYDSLGNLYYENMTGNPIIGCYVVKSTNNGQTWNTPVFAVSGIDKNWIACDQTGGPFANYVYTVMTAGSGYGSFARSTNQGQSFQQTYTFNTQTLPGMMVCVGPKTVGGDVPGGYVYVVTNSGSSVAPTYTFYRSSDGGQTFQMMGAYVFAGYLGTYVGGRPSVQNMRTRPYPFIAADNSYGPYRGRLYLVYATNVPNVDGAKSDIFCRYSTDGGASWSSPLTINDDPNSTNNYQWMPSIWCDKFDGKLYVKWFDTRNVPTSDSAEVYASYSSNGGVSFVTNQKISTAKFKIDCSTCGGGGTPRYQGDYDAIVSNGVTSKMSWSDFRNGAFGSYTAYFPDFAMITAYQSFNLNNNDSLIIRVKVPAVKLYSKSVRFTAQVDTMPVSGTLQLSFVQGKDSLISFPDSVLLKVKSIGNVTPGSYGIIITGSGPNGTPVHQRIVDILVNSSIVSVGTNRNTICDFKVNGVQYNTRTDFVFPNGSNVTVQALSPKVVGGTQYVFQNWSDNGDTTHTITVNNNISLTAFYKIQFKLIMNSSIGNTFGGNVFYDSATAFTFGVTGRFVNYNNQTYQFRGWTGSGVGSYTSPDSSGFDTVVTRPNGIINPIVQTARWLQVTSVQNISTEIPKEYKLYQNFPNPFNPVTTIEFDIVKTQDVKLQVYDILGREIRTLIETNLGAGKYRVQFNAVDLPSGIYFYKLTTPDYTNIKRMILMK